jgi:hypothetical protein
MMSKIAKAAHQAGTRQSLMRSIAVSSAVRMNHPAPIEQRMIVIVPSVFMVFTEANQPLQNNRPRCPSGWIIGSGFGRCLTGSVGQKI